MNRLGANQATVDIKADSDQQGVSTVLISNQKAEPSLFSLSANTSGNDSTGIWRAGLSYTLDNLFGLNDQLNALSAKFQCRLSIHQP